MKKARIEDEDRINKLPDDLIHRIMLFMDTRLAVQTSVLSKRWKLIWTTLPFLNFDCRYEEISKFLEHFFSCRNHQSPIMKLELSPSDGLNVRSMKKYVKYAISHSLERLHVESGRYCSLSTFSSNSLKELKLEMKYESNKVMESHCWTLPNLTTLLLKCDNHKKIPKFPESFLICLPALKTLGLNHFELPESFSLPALTTLRLDSCTLPQQPWDFPALLTLELSNVVFPENMSDYFLALTSLRNLAIDFGRKNIGCCVISSCQLLNLKISVSMYTADLNKGKVVVLAPKLRNFNAIGFFLTRFETSELENVNIKFWDFKYKKPSSMLESYQDLLKIMFSQLGSVKVLTLDLVTLQELSRISYVLVHLRCPFYNLKYLKLPHGYKGSKISRNVRRYLLGGSPSATIVKTLYPDDRIPQMAQAVTQNGVLEEPLATSTKMLVRYQYTHKSTCYDIVDMRVPKEDMVENSVVDAEKVTQIEAPVAGASNDPANSWEKSNFVLWQGHEVNSEFVGVLDLIMKKYPHTFKKLPKVNEKILTVKLNTLCSLVNAFTKTSMTEVDTEMLNEFRALFTDLGRWGFNINWLIRHLKYIKQLHKLHAIDSRIDYAKSKLQDLQTLRAEKMIDSGSFRTMGTSHAATACYIGDGLL